MREYGREDVQMSYSSSCKFETFHLLQSHFSILGSLVSGRRCELSDCCRENKVKTQLDEGVALATSRQRISVQVDKFEFAERLKDLFNV